MKYDFIDIIAKRVQSTFEKFKLKIRQTMKRVQNISNHVKLLKKGFEKIDRLNDKKNEQIRVFINRVSNFERQI